MAEVSIIIPVKDGGDDLVRCLAAIAEQTLDREIEVLDFVYVSEPRRHRLGPGSEPSIGATMFSKVNWAIQRRVREEHPFAADLIMSEDQDWSRRALEAGWSTVYEPRAVVRRQAPIERDAVVLGAPGGRPEEEE